MASAVMSRHLFKLLCAAEELALPTAVAFGFGIALTFGDALDISLTLGGALDLVPLGTCGGDGGDDCGGFGTVICSATSLKSPLGNWAMVKWNGARLLDQLVAELTPARTAPSAENSSAADMMLWCASST